MSATSDSYLLNDEMSNKENCIPNLKMKICIIGENLKKNSEVVQCAESFGVPVIFSKSCAEFSTLNSISSVAYVLEEFESDLFDSLHNSGHFILGPTALIQLAEKSKPLPLNHRPLYTTTMQDLVICFTGFRKKDDLGKMATLIHHMGGSIRKDFNNISKITHLVARTVGGEKYQYAAGFSIPIMQKEWIYEMWRHRHDKNFSASDETVIRLKLPPFSGCRIGFLGFQDDEKEHMKEIAVLNGGIVVNPCNSSCTHLVGDDKLGIAPYIPFELKDGTHVLKVEWFWASIQMELCADEKMYSFELTDSAVNSTSSQSSTDVGKCSSRFAKRKRLETASSEMQLVGTSGATFEALFTNHSLIVDQKSMSPRQQVCVELHQTETNYVKVLQTIMMVFKETLEQPDQLGGPLLVAAEIKMIFGNLPPIYNVHRKLHEDLSRLIINWKEENCIGIIILNYYQDFLKAYPPFVNFFEKTKEMLINCDMNKPRFHAFLKRCQSRPECGRQTLAELLIRPVQRLPSVVLLLNDILKKTSKRNPDYVALGKAISCLKEVMMHINEDKRKTEGQVAMFDIVNDIDNCPPNVLSSNRSLIIQADVQEISDGFTHKGDIITMFLFTDMLEICKRRSKSGSVSKSPGVGSLASTLSKQQQKTYKHIDLIHLSYIKQVVDVKEAEGFKNAFALVVRSSEELKEHLYVFALLGEDIGKDEFLHTFCQYIATTVCRVGGDDLLTSRDPQHLSLDTPETSTSPLSKAIRIASKTCDKLSRVLSIKKASVKPSLSITESPICSPKLISKSSTSNSDYECEDEF